MVRKLKAPKYKAPKKVVPENKRTVTPLVYYGGKSRDSQFILNQFPPHETFVDVFGGGGAITFAKFPSKVDVYNDLGNVSNFYKVLRDYGDELYEKLYLTPFSRQDFYNARDFITPLVQKYLDEKKLLPDEMVEWARCWYLVIMESFSHEEKATSWKVSKTVDLTNGFNSHVEELPRFVDRLRSVTIENLDFMKLLKLYDSQDTLFYLDPPYVKGTRGEGARGAYVHEMPIERHKEMLDYLTIDLKGQAVVSMYAYPMYDDMLKDWRRVSIKHPGGIKNSHSVTGDREEIVWVKEHIYGLWSLPEAYQSSDVPGVLRQELPL